MKKALTSVASLYMGMLPLFGAMQSGDITAAVREAGGSVAVASTQGSAVNSAEILTNGRWSGERYLSSESTGPLSLDFTFDDGFCPGKDIVVTGISFVVSTYQDYDKRMPKSFSVYGSNNGGETWAHIVFCESFTDYATEGNTYSGTVSFHNWKSYRKYSIRIAESIGQTSYFIQLGEVAFHGYYGGTVVRPDPVRVDLTAGARAAGAQTIESNAGNATVNTPLSMVVDGVYGYNNNRYLSNATSTKTLWDAGAPVTIDYTIGEAYERGADVIVTGYTLDCDKAFTSSLARLPKDWELQGWDGTVWNTIDRMVGFADWQEVMRVNESDGVEHPHWSYTFSISNSVSYRKYRLAVTRPNDRLNSGDYLQLTELQLWGYADADIEGTVGLAASPHDMHITADGVKGYFSPVLTVSDYDRSEGVSQGIVANIFDGSYKSSFLVRLGVDGDEGCYCPFVIGYEIPVSYLAGKDIVLKRYSLYSRTDGFGQYDKRMPKTWKLQGQAEDGRWITLDKKSDFSEWQSEDGRYFANFLVPENDLSFRSYRIVVSSVAGTSTYQSHTDMQQMLLYEIELDGWWGMGIGGAVSAQPGLSIFVR